MSAPNTMEYMKFQTWVYEKIRTPLDRIISTLVSDTPYRPVYVISFNPEVQPWEDVINDLVVHYTGRGWRGVRFIRQFEGDLRVIFSNYHTSEELNEMTLWERNPAMEEYLSRIQTSVAAYEKMKGSRHGEKA